MKRTSRILAALLSLPLLLSACGNPPTEQPSGGTEPPAETAVRGGFVETEVTFPFKGDIQQFRQNSAGGASVLTWEIPGPGSTTEESTIHLYMSDDGLDWREVDLSWQHEELHGNNAAPNKGLSLGDNGTILFVSATSFDPDTAEWTVAVSKNGARPETLDLPALDGKSIISATAFELISEDRLLTSYNNPDAEETDDPKGDANSLPLLIDLSTGKEIPLGQPFSIIPYHGLRQTAFGSHIVYFDYPENGVSTLQALSARDGSVAESSGASLSTAAHPFPFIMDIDDDSIYYYDQTGVNRIAVGGSVIETVLEPAPYLIGSALWQPVSGFRLNRSSEFLMLLHNEYSSEQKIVQYHYDPELETAPKPVFRMLDLIQSHQTVQSAERIRQAFPAYAIQYETGSANFDLLYDESSDLFEETDRLIERLAAEYAVGEGPDLIVAPAHILARLSEKGCFADASAMLTQNDIPDVIYEALKNQSGEIYAVPASVDIPLLYGSVEDLASVNSFDDLLDAMESGEPPAFSIPDPYSLFEVFYTPSQTMLVQNGELNREAYHRLLDACSALSEYLRPEESGGQLAGGQNFGYQHVHGIDFYGNILGQWMYDNPTRFGYSNMGGLYSSALYREGDGYRMEPVHDQFSAKSMPGLADGAFSVSAAVAVSRTTEHPEIAAALGDSVIGEPISRDDTDLIATPRYSPDTLSAERQQAALAFANERLPDMSVFSGGLEYDFKALYNSLKTPAVPDGRVMEALCAATRDFLYGEISAEQAADAAAEAVRSLGLS